MKLKETELTFWKMLYKICKQIYELRPWEKLYETEIFGVMIPEHEEPYFVSIMGSKKEMFGIAVYIGNKALQRFLSMQDQDLNFPPETVLTIPQFLLSWDEKDIISPDQLIIMDKSGFDFEDQQLFPHLQFISPGFVPHTPPAFGVMFMFTILTQTLEVIKKAFKDDAYIMRKGAPENEYLVRDLDYFGKELWVDKRIQIEFDDMHVQMKYDDKNYKRFLGLAVRWPGLEVNLYLLPTIIKGQGTPDTYSFALMFGDPANGRIEAMEMLQALPDYESMLGLLADLFMSKCIELNARPARIKIQNPDMMPLQQFLEDKTLVGVTFARELPALDKAIKSLGEEVGRR